MRTWIAVGIIVVVIVAALEMSQTARAQSESPIHVGACLEFPTPGDAQGTVKIQVAAVDGAWVRSAADKSGRRWMNTALRPVVIVVDCK